MYSIHADNVYSIHADNVYSIHADNVYSIYADNVYSIHADSVYTNTLTGTKKLQCDALAHSEQWIWQHLIQYTCILGCNEDFY